MKEVVEVEVVGEKHYDTLHTYIHMKYDAKTSTIMPNCDSQVCVCAPEMIDAANGGVTINVKAYPLLNRKSQRTILSMMATSYSSPFLLFMSMRQGYNLKHTVKVSLYRG